MLFPCRARARIALAEMARPGPSTRATPEAGVPAAGAPSPGRATTATVQRSSSRWCAFQVGISGSVSLPTITNTTASGLSRRRPATVSTV
jgi:hypothetical protein